MTPLAHRIAKELTLPVKDRTFNDRCGLIGRMNDMHCFEVSEVMELAKGLALDMAKRGEWLNATAFLPAPQTWLEWREDGERMGLLLTERGNCIFGVAAMDSEFASGPASFMFFAGDEADRNDLDQPLTVHTWRTLIVLLAIINTPRLIGRRQHMPHRGLERAMVKARPLVGSFPLHAWTELTLSVSATMKEADGTEHEAHLTGERCRHFCRAHYHIRNGKMVKIKAHWRGNPALGIKRTRYKIAA